MSSLSLTLFSPLEKMVEREVKVWRGRVAKAVPHAKHWLNTPWETLTPVQRKEYYSQDWEEKLFYKKDLTNLSRGGSSYATGGDR